MSLKMEYTETLEVTSCWCGIAVAIPSNLMRFARNHKGKEVYCPLGHTFIFKDSYEEQLQVERRRHEATRDLLRAEERSHSATRGTLTKTKKRIHAGVCPCCKRSFQNVKRHMDNKHPDYVEA